MVVENEGTAQTGSEDSGQNVPRETTGDDSGESGTEGEGQADQTTGEPDWQPSYKFKVHDEERDFDDWLKPVVRTKEDEDKIRDLLERAHGLDYVKQDRTTLREHNRALMGEVQEFGNVKKELKALGEFLRSGDFESFKESFNIPDELIMQYALQKVKLANASPEEQAAYQAQREAVQRTRELEEQNRAWQDSYNNYVVQNKETELNYVLSLPDIDNVARNFDARLGRQGAFRSEIINRARMHFNATGEDWTAKQAVDNFMGVIGAVPSQVSPQHASPSPGQHTQQTQTAGGQRKPVIPHIAGSGASPVKKIPKSIADLRKLGSAMT